MAVFEQRISGNVKKGSRFLGKIIEFAGKCAAIGGAMYYEIRLKQAIASAFNQALPEITDDDIKEGQEELKK